MPKLSEMSSKELAKIAAQESEVTQNRVIYVKSCLFEAMIDEECSRFGKWTSIDQVKDDIDLIRKKGKNFSPIGMKEYIITTKVDEWFKEYVKTGPNPDDTVRLYMSLDLKGRTPSHQGYVVMHLFAPIDISADKEYNATGARLSPELFSEVINTYRAYVRAYISMGERFVTNGDKKKLFVLLEFLKSDEKKSAYIKGILQNMLFSMRTAFLDYSLINMLLEANVEGLNDLAKQLMTPMKMPSRAKKQGLAELDTPIANYVRQYYSTIKEKDRLESILEVMPEEPKKKRLSPF